jgi:SWIM zinc finger
MAEASYTVSSMADGSYRVVRADDTGIVSYIVRPGPRPTCSCPAGRHGRPCKHLAMIPAGCGCLGVQGGRP